MGSTPTRVILVVVRYASVARPQTLKSKRRSCRRHKAATAAWRWSVMVTRLPAKQHQAGSIPVGVSCGKFHTTSRGPMARLRPDMPATMVQIHPGRLRSERFRASRFKRDRQRAGTVSCTDGYGVRLPAAPFSKPPWLHFAARRNPIIITEDSQIRFAGPVC